MRENRGALILQYFPDAGADSAVTSDGGRTRYIVRQAFNGPQVSSGRRGDIRPLMGQAADDDALQRPEIIVEVRTDGR